MNSFRIMSSRFRILKGGKIGLATSIALIGGMITFGAQNIKADTTTVLASIASNSPGVFNQGSTSGIPLIDATSGYHSGSFSGLSTINFDIQTQNIDALGINTIFNYNQTGGSADWYYTTVNDNTITLNAGRNITGKTLSDGITYAAVYSQNNIYTNVDENNLNYSYFGSNSVLNVQGNNTIDGNVGLNFTNWGGSSQADMLGTINLNGYNVRFGNTVFAENTVINSGTNNTINNDYTFYDTLYSDLIFNQAASILINGGLNGYSENLGGTIQSANGNLNFNGYNSIVTLGANQTITGNVTTSGFNGILIFQGSGTVVGDVMTSGGSLKEVRANGIGNILFTNINTAEIDHVNYQAAALIGFNGGLDLTVDDSNNAVNSVTFNNHEGVLQINNGNLKGIEGQEVVTTTSNNKGIVTMISGTQAIYGDIGSSGHAIKTLNIGGDAAGGLSGNISTSYSTTTAKGDIFTQNTVLNNNSTTNSSTLIMATDYDLYSTVTTSDANMGVLILAGGTQNVIGNVGINSTHLALVNSGANNAISNFGSAETPTDVYAVTLNNTGTGTTNFSRNVGATTINVANGISNFTNNVATTTTNIGSGVANLNTNGTGTTSSNIIFSNSTSATTSATGSYNTSVLGSATANLINGLTGAINFTGNDATVNVWDSKGISSAITTVTNSNTGTVNYRGDGIVSSTIGTSSMGIKELNINTNNEQSTSTGVTANGDIYSGIINLKNNGILTLSDGVDITGTTTNETNVTSLTGTTQVISAALNNDENTGTIKILGTSVITGVVGSNTALIKTIETGANSKTATFNNMVYAKNLNYTGNGTVILNSQVGLNVNTAGMVGTVDFGTNITNTGTLQIGDNVNLTTGTAGIQFADANGATLTFNGSSIVNGNVGSLSSTDAFKVINAGLTAETVSFNNNVYFMDSLNLSNNGIVQIADGKYAQRNSTSATTGAIITTSNNNKGTLNYLGESKLYGQIGTSSNKLAEVNFNTSANNIVQEIDYNVYAVDTNIGHTSINTDTATNLVNVTGIYDYAGATTMKEFRGQTTANITNDLTFGGNLIIADEKSAINFGKSHVDIVGDLTTNNGSMSFTVNTQDINNNYKGAGISTSIGSSLVTANSLNMSGNEKIHINYLGSLANSGNYTIVNATTGTTVDNTLNTASIGSYNENENGNISDNSYSIDTKVVTNATGDLIVYADRTGAANGTIYAASENYVHKSKTENHFSNAAAITLGEIAATGTQTGDMVQVIQKIDIDSFGYGNNKENLAVQVEKLAPIVNTSFAQTAIGATKLVTDTVGSRLSDVRGLSSGEEVKDKGVWGKITGSVAYQDKIGQYDGYSLSSGGVVFGIDKELNSGLIIGLAAGYTNTKTEQDNFRTGDNSTTDSYQLSAYASRTYNNAYVDGSLSYTNHNTEGTRATAIDRIASYNVDANQLLAKVNGGYNFDLENKVTLTPFASLEYSTIKQDSYKETGAGAINLSVDDVTLNRGGAGLGVKISKEIKTEKNIYIPEFKLGVNKYFGDENVEVKAQFEQGDKFTTKGSDMSDVIYDAGFGLKTKFTENTSVALSTDYERSNNGDFQGVNGQLTFRMQF